MMRSKRVNLQETEICVIEQLLFYVIEYKRTGDTDKFNTRLNDLGVKELMEVYHTIDPLASQIGDDVFNKLVTKL